jgi:uncharacterized OB-fold protein
MTARQATSELARPYVDGLAQGVLRYQRCGACGRAQRLARHACAWCGAPSPAWHDAAGTGTVFALTEVRRAPTEAFRALVPYTLALVDLDEGARLMGHAMPGLRIGQRVRAQCVTLAGHTVVRFEAEPPA